MHEMSLINDLVNKIQEVAEKQYAQRITGAKVQLGALSHISADHFREHFIEGTRGTLAEGARLEIVVSEDTTDPRAQDILLLSVTIDDKEK